MAAASASICRVLEWKMPKKNAVKNSISSTGRASPA